MDFDVADSSGFMMDQNKLPESDWQIFREVRLSALERFCENILKEIEKEIAHPGSSGHKRYLEVYNVLMERDSEIADLFNDNRRSTALFQIMKMHSRGLIPDEEFSRFGLRTRQWLNRDLSAQSREL